MNLSTGRLFYVMEDQSVSNTSIFWGSVIKTLLMCPVRDLGYDNSIESDQVGRLMISISFYNSVFNR